MYTALLCMLLALGATVSAQYSYSRVRVTSSTGGGSVALENSPALYANYKRTSYLFTLSASQVCCFVIFMVLLLLFQRTMVSFETFDYEAQNATRCYDYVRIIDGAYESQILNGLPCEVNVPAGIQQCFIN